MAERRNRAPGLLDGLTADLGGPRTSRMLEELEALVPWDRIAAPVAAMPEYCGTGAGRPAWPAVMMLKCLLLSKWFGLSDPQLEESLRDRLSFRRFVGLSLTDRTPDETTFVVFRRRLREAGLHDAIFRAVVEFLDARGVLIKQGTLVDATIIESPRGRGRSDGSSTRDADASFTRKHGRTSFGYKGHVAVDRSKVATDWRFTTAREHDGHCLDEMTADEAVAVVADALYDSGPRRAALRERGVVDAIVYQRRRGQAQLRDWQKRWNDLVARIRAPVEHPFAVIKGTFHHRRTRYRGLERNAMDFCLILVAANLRRGAFLLRT